MTVAAPDSPQSAAGHSITLRHPLAVRRLDVPAAPNAAGQPAYVPAEKTFPGISGRKPANF